MSSNRYTDQLAEIKGAVEKIGEAHDLWASKYGKLADEIPLLRDRLEELESRKGSFKNPDDLSSREARDHLDLFCKWMRRPTDLEVKHRLAAFEAERLERKDVVIGTGSSGGHAVPTQIAREIERLELKFSPVRRLVRVVQVGTPNFTHIVNLRGASAGWTSETGTRSATATPQLREVAPTFGELYAYPQASEWSLDDVFFDVGGWLAEEVAQQFAELEGEAVIRGNGTNKPTGMLNTTPTLDGDDASPLRPAAAYEYIESSTSPLALTPDSLIDLVFRVNSAYRAGASWIMNSSTAGVISKFKDTQNRYLWQSGLQAGQPNMLLGYPVEIWEQMDDVGSNKFPVAFGNFRRGYLLADRVGLRILEDRVTNPGFLRFYVRRREGGHVLNNNSLKWIRTV